MQSAPTNAAQPLLHVAPSLTEAFLQRRGVQTTLRVLAVLIGIAGAVTGPSSPV